MIYKCHVTISIIANDDAHLCDERLEYTFLLLFPIRIKIVIFFRELYLPSIIFLIFIKYTNCTKNYWYWYIWKLIRNWRLEKKKTIFEYEWKWKREKWEKKGNVFLARKKKEREWKFKRKIFSLIHMYNRL